MEEDQMRTKKFIYKVKVKWLEAKKGILSSDDKPDFEVATPAEFRGHAGIWTPENLFVASVNSCIMTTFLFYAQKNDFEFVSYSSEAEGTLEHTNNGFMFSEIIVRPSIVVKQESDIEKAKDFIFRSEKGCLISNSIKSKVILSPEIISQQS